MNRIQRLLHGPGSPRPAAVPVLLTALCVTALCLFALGQQGSPNAAAELAPDLETPFTRWLNDDVAYIIEDAERAAFERLETDEEREMFIEQFWARRDPTPGTVENEFKEEHYRRIAYANERFPGPATRGWVTDRGRMYIIYGPPDERTTRADGWELWRYRILEKLGYNVQLQFSDADGSGNIVLEEITATREPSGR